MEPLSPRDANALPKRATDLKTKAAAHIKATKEKDHPPPPPAEVIEPPCFDRKRGAVYEVGRALGKGGFAICYEGKQIETGKKFALKIVKSQMPAKMQQKFQTELSIHSKMRQANIVQFHRAFTFGNSTYLVLELCQNGSLMDMVKRRKGLTEPEVRFYTVQVAGAIKYMHARGIIHRDLKLGNIFLDKNMNAKVGDFGLAALLVTGKDMQVIRRTTICGTPNYIAPEILQKSKSGHDHAVDLWALGVIIFAMITTKPPFQSSTTDEIYRRAKEREYDWPRDVSSEVQLLVASMLEDPDRRPGPDEMLHDPFFTAGYMPVHSDITPILREMRPEEPCFWEPFTTLLAQERSERNFRSLCQECGVGPWASEPTAPPDLWREIAAEEKQGLLPVIPLADDKVYRPYLDVKVELEELGLLARQRQRPAGEKVTDALMDQLSASTAKMQLGQARPLPQSHAAQQRAQHRPTRPLPEARPMSSLSVAPTRPKSVRARIESREQPLTTSGALSVESHEHAAKGRPTSRTVLPPAAARSDVKARVVAGSQSTQPQSHMTPRHTYGQSLLDAKEQCDIVPGTQPDAVLERLRSLQAELERALNSRSMAYMSAKDQSRSSPKIVARWVDYSNKYGLGYTLSDGSVGCLLKSMPTSVGDSTLSMPPSYVLVQGAEAHFQNRAESTYVDRHQYCPMGTKAQFLEVVPNQGLARACISTDRFRVAVRGDGALEMSDASADEVFLRKRERIVLWKKFANYVVRSRTADDVLNQCESDARGVSPDDVVTFYQRFGDVGLWFFCDGHFQINFPDHTKIVLDKTATWCHFWHLPADAAERLASEGFLDEAVLEQRGFLSYPLQTLLNFAAKSATRAGTTRIASNAAKFRPEIPEEIQQIPNANDFRSKIEFLRNVVKEWVGNGGIGQSDMSRAGRLRWAGARQTAGVSETRKKHVWTTIGATGGDERKVAVVDIRKPTMLLAEMEDAPRTEAA